MERGKIGMNAYRNYKKNQGLAKAREILFRKRFVLDGDDTRLYGKEKRMDVFALREILKEIGFDYDEACDRAKKLIDEHMEEEANEHHAE